MARTPSLLALLGIAAVAGYQNRDKLGQLLGTPAAAPQRDAAGGVGGAGAIRGLSDLLSGLSGGSGRGFADLGPSVEANLTSGLRDLIHSFSGSGQGNVAESWVARGPNRSVTPAELEENLGPELIAELSERTGIGREDLLQRLSAHLPETVDRLTPEGRLPPS